MLVTCRIPRNCLTRHCMPMVLCLLVVAFFGAVPVARSQSGQISTVDVDVPFELRTPWFNPAGTEVVDEVLLQGTLHVTTQTWASAPEHIDRFALHANAVDVHGTSETTGQRFRLNGSFSFDLRDPDVTFNADGTFNVPLQEVSLRLHKVDPEPARLSQNLDLSTGATAVSIFVSPPGPVPCQRVFAPDGTPTASINCGNFVFTLSRNAKAFSLSCCGKRRQRLCCWPNLRCAGRRDPVQWLHGRLQSAAIRAIEGVDRRK